MLNKQIIVKYKLLSSTDDGIYIKTYNDLGKMFFDNHKKIIYRKYNLVDQLVMIQSITLLLTKTLIENNQTQELIEIRNTYNIIKKNITNNVNSSYDLTVINICEQKFRTKFTEIILLK